jgi:hypothetical protein
VKAKELRIPLSRITYFPYIKQQMPSRRAGQLGYRREFSTFKNSPFYIPLNQRRKD